MTHADARRLRRPRSAGRRARRRHVRAARRASRHQDVLDRSRTRHPRPPRPHASPSTCRRTPDLKLYGRPGETADQFVARCREVADRPRRRRDRHAPRQVRGQGRRERSRQIEAAEAAPTSCGRRPRASATPSCSPTAGSVLGGLLGGRKSAGGLLGGLFGDASTAARKRGPRPRPTSGSPPRRRRWPASTPRSPTWRRNSKPRSRRSPTSGRRPPTRSRRCKVGLEKTDVKVTQICLAWLPVTDLTTSDVRSSDPLVAPIRNDGRTVDRVPTERLELSLTAT